MRLACLAAPRKNRGFTLVELLTVVAITGVLAVIGVMLVRAHLQSAKSNEAIAMIQVIRAAEEGRRAETGTYLNCTTSDPAAWYPAKPDGKLRSWTFTHADATRWATLDISRPEGTHFGFLANAGYPGTTVTAPQTASKPAWGAATEPWYVIQAAGDRDSDGTLSLFVASSFNGELYTENDNE